jgi:hypothetical protein
LLSTLRPGHAAWARLIRKVYESDPLECPKCRWGEVEFEFRLDHLRIWSVPEPETYALMLTGLGLLGWIRRSKNLKETATA